MTNAVGPIFVVGSARSGTELMRQVLNLHADVAISSETHYFDDLRPRLHGGGQQLEEAELETAVNYFSAIRRHSYGLHVGREMDSLDEELMISATSCGGTADAVFVAYAERFARDLGKTVWGEKTPRHIFRTDEILAAFPTAKVLVMVRDPRAVVASYRDWTNRWFVQRGTDAQLEASIRAEEARTRASFNLTVISLLWASATRHGARMVTRHGRSRVRLIHFERLLQAPEPTVRELCGWLGLDFKPEMLRIEVVNSSYLDRGAQVGFDKSVAERWRTVLSEKEIAYIDRLVGGTVEAFGYPRSDAPIPAAFLVSQLVAAPFAVLRALLVNYGRIGAVLPYLLVRLRGLAGRRGD